MTSPNIVLGEFWTPEFPDARETGELTVTIGEQVEVSLMGALTAGLARGPRPVQVIKGDMAGRMLAHASGLVARFRPISFHGELRTGEPVSVLEAHNHGTLGAGAHYRAHVAVFGAHVTPDQRYSSVRFRPDHPYWLSHLTDGETSTMADDNSTLRVEAAPDGNWLVCESMQPVTLRQMEIRVVSGCLALAQLALRPGTDFVIRDMQVRIDRTGPWLTVHGPAFAAEPANPKLDTLLPPTELTVARFAKWVELNDRFDGLAWAVARRMPVSVQAQVQVLTSLVEGLHRRIPETFPQTWFPKARTAALKRVRKAAADAAAQQAAHEEGLDSEIVYERVKNAVGHIDEMSYRERAEAVVERVGAAIPELVEIVSGLGARLTDPRHDFAHQLPQDGKKDPLEDRVRRWIVIAKVAPWLLRALL